MLQDEGCDPHIVGRDGSALLPQLPVNSAVMMRGLFIGIEHTDARLQQKAAQDSLVARSRAAHNKPAHGEAGAQFSQHDEGQPDFIGEFDRFDNRHVAPAKVGIAVRIERQPHRHISSSMVSCAAKALSKAGSLRQVPAMSREIALPVAIPGNASTPGQGFDRYLIQAFAPLARGPAKRFVQSIRHIADGVLHASIVGSVGNKCKRNFPARRKCELSALAVASLRLRS